MNRSIKFALVVSAALLASTASGQKTVTKVVGGNQEFVLTASDVARYREQALDGSMDAASKLAAFYGTVKLDTDQDLYWTQIAAENGSVAAMHDYWVVARLSNNPDERRRGLFWLKRAASLGDKLSQEALKNPDGQ